METPVIEHERPAIETPTATDNVVDLAPTSQLSEYEKHKVARGFGKPPAIPNPPAEAKAPETPAEQPDAAEPAEPAIPEPVDKAHRFEDPDTGEVLDLRRRASKRVKSLLSERARQRDYIAQLERQLSQRPGEGPAAPRTETTPPAPSTATDDPEPTLDNFASYDDYTKATARWVARQEFKSQQDSARASGEQTRHREQFSKSVESYKEKVAAIRPTLPDWDEVIDKVPMIPETRHVTQAILDSPVGPQLAYFLGKHPEAMEAIMMASTEAAHLRLIGKYEAQVEAATSAQPKAQPSRAPEPVAPVHTASSAPTAPGDHTASLASWRKARGMHPTQNR